MTVSRTPGRRVLARGQRRRQLLVGHLDTNGAGDAWAAGFLFGHLRGWSLPAAGALASLVGAETVAHLGPLLPEAAWQEIFPRAMALRPGLDPSEWIIDQAARIAFMVASYAKDDVAFAAAFDGFCATAGLNELIALCRGLPVYPGAALLEPRAREAVRSGMKPVFEAVAHRNPYPVECFAEDAWNQMVVKCVFSGLPIETVVGLHARRNGDLVGMLRDLVSERHAAGRALPDAVHRFIDGTLTAP